MKSAKELNRRIGGQWKDRNLERMTAENGSEWRKRRVEERERRAIKKIFHWKIGPKPRQNERKRRNKSHEVDREMSERKLPLTKPESMSLTIHNIGKDFPAKLLKSRNNIAIPFLRHWERKKKFFSFCVADAALLFARTSFTLCHSLRRSATPAFSFLRFFFASVCLRFLSPLLFYSFLICSFTFMTVWCTILWQVVPWRLQ